MPQPASAIPSGLQSTVNDLVIQIAYRERLLWWKSIVLEEHNTLGTDPNGPPLTQVIACETQLSTCGEKVLSLSQHLYAYPQPQEYLDAMPGILQELTQGLDRYLSDLQGIAAQKNVQFNSALFALSPLHECIASVRSAWPKLTLSDYIVLEHNLKTIAACFFGIVQTFNNAKQPDTRALELLSEIKSRIEVFDLVWRVGVGKGLLDQTP